jgi:hypothetical protein
VTTTTTFVVILPFIRQQQEHSQELSTSIALTKTCTMDTIGSDFNVTGSVMSKEELQTFRAKRGECITCGQKCFRKKLFKMIPLDQDGLVLNGRCLKCRPLLPRDISSRTTESGTSHTPITFKTSSDSSGILTASVSRRMTDTDRYSRSQMSLQQVRSIQSLNNGGSTPRSFQAAQGDSRRSFNSNGTGSSNNNNNMNELSTACNNIGSGNHSQCHQQTSFTVNRNASDGSRGPPPPPARAKSEHSLSSIGSASISAASNYRPRVTPTLPEGRRALVLAAAALPPTPPVRTASDSYSQDGQPHASREDSTGRPTKDIVPCVAPAPPLSSPFSPPKVPYGKKPDDVEKNARHTSPTSVAAPTPPQEGQQLRRPSIMDYDPTAAPSAQIIEQAHQVLMAARQRGMMYPDMAQPGGAIQSQHHALSSLYEQRAMNLPTNVVIHDGTDGRATNTMGRMESEVTLDTAFVLPPNVQRVHGGMQSEDSSLVEGESWTITEQQQDTHQQKGILNRGGAFVPPTSGSKSFRNGESSRWSAGGGNGKADRPMGAPVPGKSANSSYRTLSSISSYEDDLHQHQPATHSRARGGSMDDLFETSESSLSIESPKKDISMEIASNQESKDSRSQGTHSLGDDFFELIETLRESKALPQEAAYALKCLSNKTLATEDYGHLADIDAMSTIVDAMVVHEGDYQVQRWGCHAIWAMSGITRTQIAIVEASGLDAILGAVERFSGDLKIIESALSAMSNLGAAKDNLALFVEKGAIEKIVKVMATFADIVDIQIRGCGVISNLAKDKSPFKEQFLQSGAGEAAIVAMVLHQDNIQLQEKALRALRNLCIHCDPNKVDAANMGGSDAAITAMQVHRDEPGVQEEGAWLIAVLTRIDENRFSIGDCGGVEVVLRAMALHHDYIGVIEQGLKALHSLSLDLDNTKKMLKYGGIQTVVNSMHGHPNSATIQKLGCSVLAHFAETSNEAKMQIVDQEGLDAVAMAMFLHSDDVGVQANACVTLFNVAIEENVVPMHSAGVVELAKTAMNTFPDQCSTAVVPLVQFFEGVLPQRSDQD